MVLCSNSREGGGGGGGCDEKINKSYLKWNFVRCVHSVPVLCSNYAKFLPLYFPEWSSWVHYWSWARAKGTSDGNFRFMINSAKFDE